MTSSCLAARAAMITALLSAAPGARADASALRHAESWLTAELAELKMLGADLERARGAREKIDVILAEVPQELAALDADLDGVARSAGFERSGRDVASGELRFHRGGPVAEAVEALQALELPRVARLRRIRCDGEGCTIAIAPVVPPGRPLDDGSVQGWFCSRAQLPERPPSPGDAELWERVQGMMAECKKRRASLGDLADLKHLEWLVRGLIVDRQTPRLRTTAAQVSEAGAKVFELDWHREDVRVAVPGAGRELKARLADLALVRRADGTYVPKRPETVEELIRELKQRARANR